jgi:hypothetical protein
MKMGARFAQVLGMASSGSLIDTDPIAEANTRDAVHAMKARRESAWASRQRLKRILIVVVASLIVSFLVWRVLVLY